MGWSFLTDTQQAGRWVELPHTRQPTLLWCSQGLLSCSRLKSCRKSGRCVASPPDGTLCPGHPQVAQKVSQGHYQIDNGNAQFSADSGTHGSLLLAKNPPDDSHPFQPAFQTPSRLNSSPPTRITPSHTQQQLAQKMPSAVLPSSSQGSTSCFRASFLLGYIKVLSQGCVCLGSFSHRPPREPVLARLAALTSEGRPMLVT